MVIAGGGPVGMQCALELAAHEVSCLVLEAGDRLSQGSRAICISRRSLEILDRSQAGQKVADKGLWWTRGTSFYRLAPVFHLDMPHTNDQKYPPFVNIQQYHLEDFLLDEIAKRPSIDYRWQNRITDVALNGDRVELTIETPEGAYAVAADYVIACDGARSAVRKALGLALKGTSYEGRYLIADIKAKLDLPIQRHVWFDPPSNPGSTVIMHAQPDHVWRIDYQLRDEEDPDEELQEDRIKARIQAHLDMLGSTQQWTLEWYSLYKAHAVLLDDYRKGRIFFAGDAAHLVPIFGVRGLNSGFEDAHNLGWKLARAVRGEASDALLDSYTPERRAATLDTLSNATKSTWFMTPVSHGYRLMRDAALSLAIDHDFVRPLINPRQSTPFYYHDSPLNLRAASDHIEGGLALGDLFPNTILMTQDYRLDYLSNFLGPDFTAIVFSEFGDLSADARRHLSRLEDISPDLQTLVICWHEDLAVRSVNWVRDKAGLLFTRCGALTGTTYLLRPDRHVAGRWRSLDSTRIEAGLAQLLDGGSA